MADQLASLAADLLLGRWRRQGNAVSIVGKGSATSLVAGANLRQVVQSKDGDIAISTTRAGLPLPWAATGALPKLRRHPSESVLDPPVALTAYKAFDT